MVLGFTSKLRLGKLTSGVDPNKGAISQASPVTLTEDDFMTADVAVVAGKKTILGEYLINPQDEQALGYGSAQFPENQGTLFMNIKDNATSPAELEGTVRILISDYHDRRSYEVFKGSASDLRLGETDITKRIKFALREKWGSQNDKIIVEFTPQTIGSGSVGNDESVFKIASSVVPAQGLRNL